MDPWITSQSLKQTLGNRGILLDRLYSSSSVLLNPLYKFKMHLRVLDGYKEGSEGSFFHSGKKNHLSRVGSKERASRKKFSNSYIFRETRDL